MTDCENEFCEERFLLASRSAQGQNDSAEQAAEVSSKATPCTLRGRRLFFCQTCKALAERSQFCFFCFQVYRDREQEVFDGKEWICCDDDKCRRWTHVLCETLHGGLTDPTAVNPYKCPSCRGTPKDHPSQPSVPSGKIIIKNSSCTVPGPNAAANPMKSHQRHHQASNHTIASTRIANIPTQTPTNGAAARKRTLKKSNIISLPRQTAASSMSSTQAQRVSPLVLHRLAASSELLSLNPKTNMCQAGTSVVDFNKLDSNCLRRYHRRYHIQTKPQIPKHEMAALAEAHFTRQTVVESEVLKAFFAALSKS